MTHLDGLYLDIFHKKAVISDRVKLERRRAGIRIVLERVIIILSDHGQDALHRIDIHRLFLYEINRADIVETGQMILVLMRDQDGIDMRNVFT